MSESDFDHQDPPEKLQELLTAAGFIHQRVSSGGRTMIFNGQFRDWVLFAHLNDSWLHIQTTVCAFPAEPGLRAELLLWMARAGRDLSLLKYTVDKEDRVILEAQVRAERLEAEDVSNLVGFLQNTAERDYLAILRLARGEARLEALSAAFQRDALPGEGSATG
jgi:hypothetical protein